jgi:hypothetical protein
MLYDYIIKTYKEGEPIFFSDLMIEEISKPAMSQQLKTLCKDGRIAKYENGIYYIPKKSLLKSPVGPSADTVAKYRFISRGDRVDGFYTGNKFANQIGISTQVPQVVEIVSNNTNSAPREVIIGKRRFFVKKPVTPVTAENVYVLQMLELLKDLDKYLDYSYDIAKQSFAEYIKIHGINRHNVDLYIRKYPASIFKNYYELELDNVFAQG